MKEINIKDLDFNKLKYHDFGNAESDIYFDDIKLYKLFKTIYYDELENKRKKIEILNSKTLDEIIIVPDTLIIQNDCFIGCGMNYINDSINLFQFRKNYNELNDLFEILKKISIVLKDNIHPNNITICDLSFSNIIIDSKMNPYICDIDSCSIDSLKTELVSSLVYYYYKYRKVKIDINENIDNLSILLNTLYLIFKKQIRNITEYEYDELKEQIYFLEEIKDLFLELKKQERTIPEIPYIHELIKKNENYKFKS